MIEQKMRLNDFYYLKKNLNPQKIITKNPRILKYQIKIAGNNIKYVENKLGTANGIWFNHLGINIIALPGVPDEMKMMMKKSLLPNFKNKVKKINLLD